MNHIFTEITDELFISGYNIEDIAKGINDAKTRLQWKINSFCIIYSRSDATWYKSLIFNIFKDKNNEEWLSIKYDKQNQNMQRFGQDIKPIDCNYNYDHTIMQYISKTLKQKTKIIYTNTESKHNNIEIDQNRLLQKIKNKYLQKIFHSLNNDKKMLLQKVEILESKNQKLKRQQIKMKAKISQQFDAEQRDIEFENNQLKQMNDALNVTIAEFAEKCSKLQAEKDKLTKQVPMQLNNDVYDSNNASQFSPYRQPINLNNNSNDYTAYNDTYDLSLPLMPVPMQHQYYMNNNHIHTM